MINNIEAELYKALFIGERIFSFDNKRYLKFDSIFIEIIDNIIKVTLFYKGEPLLTKEIPKSPQDCILNFENFIGAFEFTIM